LNGVNDLLQKKRCLFFFIILGKNEYNLSIKKMEEINEEEYSCLRCGSYSCNVEYNYPQNIYFKKIGDKIEIVCYYCHQKYCICHFL
jgi:hypothetical protein